jgi:phosphopantothenoylcysteine decarboxylase/phosphopantothenate--cysteine ligase
MNTQMLLNPAVQDNIRRLRETHGYHVLDPDSGDLACQEIGPGRMPDPPILLDALADIVVPASRALLAGLRVMVTAGPTVEALDPVRFISNRSSGKMGFAVARVAARLGAQVTLVAGPCALSTPPRVTRVDVESAADMHAAVFSRVCHAEHGQRPHVVVKAAAVADWTPSARADHKLKKTDGPEDGAIHLSLTRTRDILKDLGALDDDARPFLIGFAAETRNVEEYAAGKLLSKRADVIVGNIVIGPDSAFGGDRSSALLLDREGRRETAGPADKEDIAVAIWSFAALARRWPTVQP